LKTSSAKKRRDNKSYSPGQKKKNITERIDEEPEYSGEQNRNQNTLQKKPSRERKNDVFDQNNFDFESHSGSGGKAENKFDKTRINSQYTKRPTKQMMQVYGEFSIEEFNKIGNQFSNEVIANRSIRIDTVQSVVPSETLNNKQRDYNYDNRSIRNDTVQSGFPCETPNNKHRDYDDYPTFTSVLNADESMVRRNNNDKNVVDSPFNLHKEMQKQSTFNKSNNANRNNQVSQSTQSQFDFNNAFHHQSDKVVNNNTVKPKGYHVGLHTTANTSANTSQ